MNKAQKKKTNDLRDKAVIALTEMVELLTEAQDELQEIFDSRSEKWQEGEKGQAMQEEIDRLESAANETQSALDGVEYLDLFEID